MHGRGDAEAGAVPLAAEPDFRLGDLCVSPSLRTLTGSAGAVTVEPLVMRLLLVLAEAPGQVLTRFQLEQRCWGAVCVGEDSLTRAVGEVRRALTAAGSADIRLETIPKTGYRLAVTAPEDVRPPSAPATAESPAEVRASRRAVLAALGGVGLAAGAAGLWWARRPDPKQLEVAALTAEGWDSWRTGLPEPAAAGVAAMTRATGLDPMDAGAWGLLALLQRASLDYAAPAEMDRTRFAAERAARRALAIDPRQGEALAALAGLHPMFGDWQGSWKRLSDVLRVAPGEVAARTDLGLLEMSTGRPSAALAISKSLVREDPLAAVHQHMLVYRLWSNGRLREMDLAADRALAQWPLHPAIWFARMWTYGYTGRTEAARQLLADAETRPDMPQAQVELLDRTMAALGSGTDVASAVEMNLALARRAPGAAVMAVQHLAALGAIEQAFDVAFGYLVRQGPEVGLLRHRDSASVSLNEQHHRKTMMLFIPATAPLRRDARFATLCREIGLEAFWRARGVVPDFRKAGAPA